MWIGYRAAIAPVFGFLKDGDVTDDGESPDAPPSTPPAQSPKKPKERGHNRLPPAPDSQDAYDARQAELPAEGDNSVAWWTLGAMSENAQGGPIYPEQTGSKKF